MIFRGIGRRFSTQDDAQYEAIGRFWDEMADKYGRESLSGIGMNWTDNAFDYAIGRMDGESVEFMDGMQQYEVLLPDKGWELYSIPLDMLEETYGIIWQKGPLSCEIERFSDDGMCCIEIYREQNCPISVKKCGTGVVFPMEK